MLPLLHIAAFIAAMDGVPAVVVREVVELVAIVETEAAADGSVGLTQDRKQRRRAGAPRPETPQRQAVGLLNSMRWWQRADP